MLIQHILTEEIFSKAFDSEFHRDNNIARELYKLEATFFTGGLKKSTLKGLEAYYAAIRAAAAQIGNHHEKQTFLKVTYENFYNFEIIGEASHNIEQHYPAFAAEHPELPLAIASQMCNAVAHGYFKVDLEIVWKTIHADLPGLHAQVQEIQQALPSENDNVAGVPNCSVAGDSMKPT